MEQIVVAAEVAALVGEEDLRLLRRQAGTGYTCAVCRVRDQSLAEHPANAVVYRDELLVVVRLAHVGGSPSQVVDVEPGTLRPARETPASAVAVMLPSAAEPGVRPLLVVEMAAAIAVLDGGVDRVDRLVTELIRCGLHMVSQLGHVLPPAAGWSVTLTGPRTVRVDGPGVEMVYDGTLYRESAWEQVIAYQGGRCEVLVGVGMQLAEHLDKAGEGLRRLREASRSGLLVGGLVDVS